MKLFPRYLFALLLLSILIIVPHTTKAYSVFAHEAVVDASWNNAILPLLKAKYPGSTEVELVTARSYAYGGALIADMGYFPFGNPYFTNLLHYSRSGDFVENLISQSSNLN